MTQTYTSEARLSSRGRLILAALFAGLPLLAAPADGSGAARPIDVKNSTMTVYAGAGGVFGAFGHDHEISAPIAAGTVDPVARRVEFRVDTASLRVRDPKASEQDRAEVQKNMLGPAVLDAGRYREIVFTSTAVEKTGDGWTVRGNLTLHGETQPVTVSVRETDGRYVGSARLHQTAFGIKPVTFAGGTVRVKNELRIDFDIRLAR